MSEVSLQAQKAIVEQNIAVVVNSIYNQVINKRVALKVGDKEMETAAVTQLTKLEKMKDEFEAILTEVNVLIDAEKKPE
jgi:hypothetical protein